MRDLIKTPKIYITLNKKVRKENETWEEDGKRWIHKNGVTKRDTILQEFSSTVPLFCPKCKSKFHHDNDIVMYKIHSMCMKCVAEFETQLRIEGKFEQYQKDMINKNIDYDIDRLKKELEYFLQTPLSNIRYNDAGQKEETIIEDDREVAIKNVNKKLQYLESLKIK
jgi:hypothetical protein